MWCASALVKPAPRRSDRRNDSVSKTPAADRDAARRNHKSSREFPMSDEVLKLIKDKEVQFVDLRFNDLRGKMQHVTFDVSMIDKEIFAEGTMFDGSSIAGWKAINESDMVMRPDPLCAGSCASSISTSRESTARAPRGASASAT
jgi:hypothetical protein